MPRKPQRAKKKKLKKKPVKKAAKKPAKAKPGQTGAGPATKRDKGPTVKGKPRAGKRHGPWW